MCGRSFILDRSPHIVKHMDTTPQPPRLPRTALVTGAAKGIGAAMAIHLAALGIRVAVHYRSSKIEADATLASCEQHTGGCVLVQGDMTDPEQAQRVCDDATAAFGEVDLLVNNIGNYLRKDVLDMSVHEWRDQVESNLYTPFFACKAIVPGMRTRGFGRVINIGYAGATHPFYNRRTVPYHIAKTGVSIFTRCLAATVAPDGVTVNAIGIGVIENSVSKPSRLPAGRTGSFADVCNALEFLIKPESCYINGAQLDVSGGWLPEQVLF